MNTIITSVDVLLFLVDIMHPRGGEVRLEMITTFTYMPSLVTIDARNFELSW